MLAQVEAVIRGEEYVRVVQIAAVVQRFDEVSYHVVHGQHGLQTFAVEFFHVLLLLLAQGWIVAYPIWLVGDILLVERWLTRQRDVGVGVLIPGRRGGRLVGGLRADPHEKGPVCRKERRVGPGRACYVVGGLVRDHVGLVVGLGVVVDHMAVLVEGVAEVVARHRVPFVPPGRNVGLVVAVEILPEEGRPVALLLDPGGHRRVLVAQEAELLEAAERRLVAQDLVVVGVLAAQDGGPAGTAQGVGHERVVEGRALVYEQRLYVGHVPQGYLVQVVHGQVVGEDQDHVRWFRLLLLLLGWLPLGGGEAGGEGAGHGQPEQRVESYYEYSLGQIHYHHVRIARRCPEERRPDIL